jgi:hypothetical protein
MSLEVISAQLLELDGVVVSKSTLSNWQSGRPPRRGAEEDERIYALERVLRLRRGELLLLLDDRPARGGRAAAAVSGDDETRPLRTFVGTLGGVSSCITIAVEERVHVAADRRPQQRVVRQTVRAVAENADCYWAIYSADATGPIVPPVKPLRGCRVGRLVPRGDLLAVELLFDRILKPGESHTFDFCIEEKDLTQPVRECRRWAGPPALERLDMTVRFETPPRQVLAGQWRTRRDEIHGARPVPVVDGIARLRLSHPVPGMYGLTWRW